MDVILLGEIEDKLNGVESKIDTIKSQTDNIYNRVDTEIADIVGKVATNNTASETGSLSQKLSSIINYVKTNNTASSTGNISQKISHIISQNAAHGKKIRTAVGTENWTCPAGVYVVYAIVIGSGGNGGSGNEYCNDYGNCENLRGGSGGGGAMCSGICGVVPGTTYTIKVGGGTSSFGAFLEAGGGGAGSSANYESGQNGTPGSVSFSKMDCILTFSGSGNGSLGYNGKGNGGSGGYGNNSGSVGSPGMVSLFW